MLDILFVFVFFNAVLSIRIITPEPLKLPPNVMGQNDWHKAMRLGYELRS